MFSLFVSKPRKLTTDNNGSSEKKDVFDPEQ